MKEHGTATGVMDVVVDDRNTGKTTLLLDWLQAGEPIDVYPHWSRLLVCPTARRVAVLALETQLRHGDGPWLKCIVSLRDLQMLFRGAIRPDTVEYAVDDAELLIYSALQVPQNPTLITMLGKVAYQ